jgi:hypothetical protein
MTTIKDVGVPTTFCFGMTFLAVLLMRVLSLRMSVDPKFKHWPSCGLLLQSQYVPAEDCTLNQYAHC